MHTLVAKPAHRKRRRHSEEFKRQIVEACMAPGVSVAAIALANGLNANYLRRWVRAYREDLARGERTSESIDTSPRTMVPARLSAGTAPVEVRLDIRRGGTTVQMAWPLESAVSLGQLLREVLR